MNFWILFVFSGLGQLGQTGVSMGGFGQSLGQLNQGSGLSPALPISTAAASTVYQAHYGLNSLGKNYMFLKYSIVIMHFNNN